jgi:hypothetical protein
MSKAHKSLNAQPEAPALVSNRRNLKRFITRDESFDCGSSSTRSRRLRLGVKRVNLETA